MPRRGGVVPMDVEYEPDMRMDVEEETTTLFQLPISNAEFAMYQTPPTQGNPAFNCTTVSAFFLGLLTPGEAARLSARTDMTGTLDSKVSDITEWAAEISRLGITGTLHVEPTANTFPTLFPNHAAFVIKERLRDSVAHAFLLARDQSGTLGIIDPQIRRWYTDIPAYLSEGALYDTGRYWYIAYGGPRTRQQIDDMASKIRASRQCRMAMGARRKTQRGRRTTASAPPSGPKRSVPSAVSKRRK